jgi:hypothetical protein
MSPDEGPQPVVDELVEASLAFTLALRSRQGFSEDWYERLVRALARCAEEWRELDCIPRLAVNVLVDLQPTMLASVDLYEPDLRARIVDAADHIGDLATDAVGL